MSQLLRAALAEAVERDPRIHLLGEALDLSPTTRGLSNTRRHLLPAADQGLAGVAVGLAWSGALPVVELSGPAALATFAAAWAPHLSAPSTEFPLSLILRVPLIPGEAIPSGLLALFPEFTIGAGGSEAEQAHLLRAALSTGGRHLLLEAYDLPEESQSGLDQAQGPVALSLVVLGPERAAAEAARERLRAQGVATDLLVLATLRPLDAAALQATLARSGRPVLVGLARQLVSTSALEDLLHRGFLHLESPPFQAPAEADQICTIAHQSLGF